MKPEECISNEAMEEIRKEVYRELSRVEAGDVDTKMAMLHIAGWAYGAGYGAGKRTE